MPEEADQPNRAKRTVPPGQGTWCQLLGVATGFALFAWSLKSQKLLWEAFAGSPRPVWVDPVRVVLACAPAWVVAYLTLKRLVTRQRPAVIGLCIGALLLWIPLLAFVLSPFGEDILRDYAARREFNAQEWRAYAEKRRNFDAFSQSVEAGEPWPPKDRLYMVHDLIASEILDGRLREDVRSLLGSPETEGGSMWDGRKHVNWDDLYFVGQHGGLLFRSDWLGINYDGTGRISKYRIVLHYD